MPQFLLTGDPSGFARRSHSSTLILLDATAHSPKIDANISRAENALHRGPQNPNLRKSQAEVVRVSGKARALRRFGLSEGCSGDRWWPLGRAQFVLLSLGPRSVLIPLSGTEALTSQYCRIVWGSIETGLRRGNPTCHQRPSPVTPSV